MGYKIRGKIRPERTLAPHLYFLGVCWLFQRLIFALLRDFSRGLRFPSSQVMFAARNREESGIKLLRSGLFRSVEVKELDGEGGLLFCFWHFWVISAYVWIAWLLNEVRTYIMSSTERISVTFSLVFVVWVKCIVHVVARHGRKVLYQTISCIVVFCNRRALCRLRQINIVVFFVICWKRYSFLNKITSCTTLFISPVSLYYQIKLKSCIFNTWKFEKIYEQGYLSLTTSGLFNTQVLLVKHVKLGEQLKI